MVELRRLCPDALLTEIIDAWLFQLAPQSRRLGLSLPILPMSRASLGASTPTAPGVLHLEHLSKPALRAAFASWAADHAASSVVRAHSAWSSLSISWWPRTW